MKKLLFMLFLMTLGLSGCKDDDIPADTTPQQEDVYDGRTLLYYIVSNNSGGADLDDLYKGNIASIYSGLTRCKEKSTVLIFYRPRVQVKDELIPVPSILKYENDGNGNINGQPVRDITESDTTFVVQLGQVMKTYSNDIVSTQPETMEGILKDMVEIAPSKEYGLFFSSHGMGWLPGESYESRSFGDDNSNSIGIPQLARILKGAFPPDKLEFLLFDACLMGQAEVFYDLRDAAHVCIASAASVPGKGFPYKQIVPALLHSDSYAEEACTGYETFYTLLGESGTVITCVAVDLTKMEPLAEAVKNNLAIYKDSLRGNFIGNVQCYGAAHSETEYSENFMSLDLADYFKQMTPNKELPEDLRKALDDVVISKGFVDTDRAQFHTPLVRSKFCGMGMFVPDIMPYEGWNYNELFSPEATEWYQTVGWANYRVKGFTDPRAILAYLVSNNSKESLDNELKANVVSMYKGLVRNNKPADLFVYYRPNRNDAVLPSPAVYKFHSDGKGKVNGHPKLSKSELTFENVLKIAGAPQISYSADQVSTSMEEMKIVLTDMTHLTETKNFGLIFGSHGSGFKPGTPLNTLSRSFGNDAGVSIGIPDIAIVLKEVFSDLNLDYILFDACHMACAEVCYDLRDCARFLVASPASVPSAGFPYEVIMYLLYHDYTKGALSALCEFYTKFYEQYHPEAAKNNIICCSAFDLRMMNRLGVYVNSMLSDKASKLRDDFINTVQAYGFIEGPDKADTRFITVDLLDYFNHLYENRIPREVIYCLQKAVIGGSIIDTEIPGYPSLSSKRYTGLGMYIPDLGTGNELLEYLDSVYGPQATEWYNAVGWDNYRLNK